MKYLLIILLILSFTGCTNTQNLLDKMPDGGFKSFSYSRMTGPTSAYIYAGESIKTGNGFIVDKVVIEENFTFGSVRLEIIDYWMEDTKNGGEIKEDY